MILGGTNNVLHTTVKKFLCTLWSLALAKKSCNNINHSHAQVSKLCYFFWLCFDQWKTFSDDYMPIRVWMLFVYKFTENDCRLRLFSEFIQTQKRYPTFLDKISILTWKLLIITPYQAKIVLVNLTHKELSLCKIQAFFISDAFFQLILSFT